MTTLAYKPVRPLRYEPLRELRQTSARSACEATNWLNRLQAARKSPRTIGEYARIIDGLLALYPDLNPADFTEDHLTGYLLTHREPSRPVVKSALNGWFTWMRKTRRIPANPVELVPDIKAREQRLRPIFTDTQVAALENLPSPDGVLMRVLFTTGIRRGEAINLKARHINFDRAHIEIHHGKGGHDRLVPLPPVLAGKLDHWLTIDGLNLDDHLWYSRPGGHWRQHDRPVANSTYQRWWKECLAAADVPYLNPHASRHTMATRAIRAGISIDMVRRALGHRNIATTVQTYVHTTVEDMVGHFALLETH